MKKIISCLLVLLMFACVVSCRKGNGDSKVEETPEYYGKDLEEFVEVYSKVNSADASENRDRVYVPILKAKDYRFWAVEVNDHYYFYYYVPSDYTKDTFNHVEAIIVSVRRSSKESVSLDAEPMDPIDSINPINMEEFSYNNSQNEWTYKKETTKIYVSMPDDFEYKEGSEITDFFTFVPIEEYEPLDSDTMITQENELY